MGTNILIRLPAVVALVLAVGPAAAGPRIAFDSVSFDWGTVFEGSGASHTFEMRNEGDATLEITNVQTSCGCTVASDWPKTLAPGAKGSVTASVNTSHRRGYSMTMVTVVSNDPENPQVRLRIGGLVQALVTFTPGPAVSFDGIGIGESAVRSLDVYPLEGHTFVIENAKGTNPHVEASWKEARNEQGTAGYRLSLTLKDTAPAGQVNDMVRVIGLFDGQTKMDQPVSVRGDVVGQITVTPDRLAFSKGGEEETLTVTLKRREGGRLRIYEARADRRELSVKRKSGPKRDEVLLEVTSRFPPAENVSVTTGDIIVRTNASRQKELRIQYFVRFPGPVPVSAPRLQQ